MVKADGCVAIHADGGAYKPLNWMNSPNTLEENEGEWIVANPKGETITITLHEIFLDTHHHLGDDPGLSKDGVEAHLQELLAAMPETIEEGLTLNPFHFLLPHSADRWIHTLDAVVVFHLIDVVEEGKGGLCDPGDADSNKASPLLIQP
jgi:hypothetical protein